MKAKCLKKSIYRGEIVSPGKIIDIDEKDRDCDLVKYNFVLLDKDASEAPPSKTALRDAKKKTKSKILVAGLTREQVIMKLRELGTTIGYNASDEQLVELYNTSSDNIGDVARKNGINN